MKLKTPNRSVPSSLQYAPYKRLDRRWTKLRKLMEAGKTPESVALVYGWTVNTAKTHMSWMRTNWIKKFPKLRNSYQRDRVA